MEKPRRHLLLTLLSLVVILATSCARVPLDQFYISLKEEDGLSVTATGQMELDGLAGDSSIPTSYRLKRAEYEIVFAVNTGDAAPNITLRIDSDSPLRLLQRSERGISPGARFPCGNYSEINETDELAFSWTRCKPTKAKEYDRIIHFDVIDKSGEVIRQERIPFDLKRNGVLWVTDSW